MKGKPKAKPSLSMRERLLLMVLPGALVIAGYSLLFNAAHIGALTKLNQQLAQTRQRTGGAPVASRSPEANLNSLKVEREELRHKLDAFEAGGGDGLQRSEVLVRLVKLLQAHDLVIIEEGPTTPLAAALPASRSLAAKNIPVHPDTIWQIRFLGAWDSVRAALQMMPAEPDITCLPLSLSMAEPQDSTTLREWTLRVRL